MAYDDAAAKRNKQNANKRVKDGKMVEKGPSKKEKALSRTSKKTSTRARTS